MTSDEPTTNPLPVYLASVGVDATLVRTDREIPTVDLAAAALGVPPAAIVKSIVFEHKLDPTRVCLAIVPGDARVSRHKVSEALGVRQLKLASPETVLEATGYRAGGVPPVCHLRPIAVALDRRVFEHSVVFGGGGDEWHMLRITPHDIQRLTAAVVADLIEDAEPT